MMTFLLNFVFLLLGTVTAKKLNAIQHPQSSTRHSDGDTTIHHERHKERFRRVNYPDLASLRSLPPYPKFRFLQSNLFRNSTMYFIGEIYSQNPERLAELKLAVTLTSNANPQSRYVMVVSEHNFTLIRDKLLEGFENISYDLYYTPEVLYSTLIEIGNHYFGMKFAGSADNYYTKVNFTCNFQNPKAVFALSRNDVLKADKNGHIQADKNCDFFKFQGSFDCLLFDFIPKSVLASFRYGREYWGAENVATFILQKNGYKVYNLCKKYFPYHIHMNKSRPSSRIRINAVLNSALALTDPSGVCKF